jgi:hypothetical protein
MAFFRPGLKRAFSATLFLGAEFLGLGRERRTPIPDRGLLEFQQRTCLMLRVLPKKNLI